MSTNRPSYLSALMSLFGRNFITLSGGILAGISAFVIVSFILLGVLEITDSPYVGIMAFLVLPGVFIAGLLLVPVGVLWELKFGKSKVEDKLPYPIIDFNDPHTRRVGALVVIFTGFNVLIIGTVTFMGVHFMDSTEFCGEVCHTVMEPEYTAYLKSPHQRVACVECHIGPGADWFVKSKLSGLRQVLAVAIDSYPRPIPSPVENLRPSRDTCEQCHWPAKLTGDRLKIIRKYQEDEANTPMSTVLLLHVGGGDDGGTGIHSRHINSDMQVYYTSSDYERQNITRVRVVDAEGKETIYTSNAENQENAGVEYEERMMDCIDCHNRPSHIFYLPEEEVNKALSIGIIDATLPYIRKTGVEVLTNATGKHGDIEQIREQVLAFYKEGYPELLDSRKADIDNAIQKLQDIYKSNVFPDMNVFWGTHPMNIGHEKSPGCFRCHNEELRNAEGKPIGQDCDGCHTVLAWDEAEPEILETLGH